MVCNYPLSVFPCASVEQCGTIRALSGCGMSTNYTTWEMPEWVAVYTENYMLSTGPEEANLKWYGYREKLLQFTEFREHSHCFSWSALQKEQVGNAWSLRLVSLLRYCSNNHQLQRFMSSHLAYTSSGGENFACSVKSGTALAVLVIPAPLALKY